MNNQSVTISQCENGFQVLVESGEGEYLSQMYIANVIEKKAYDFSVDSVSIVEILKKVFPPESVGT